MSAAYNYDEEIKTPFRWYDTAQRLVGLRPNCEHECQYKLYTPPDRLLPFMLMRDQSSSPLTSWNIYDQDDNLVSSVSLSNIEKKTFGGKDYLIYYGDQIQYLWLDCGFYKATISDGTNTWFSEVFYVFESTRDEVARFPLGTDNWTPVSIPNEPLKYCADTGFSDSLIFTTTTTINNIYLFEFEITDFSAGSLNLTMGGRVYSIYANGVYSIALQADSTNGTISFVRSSDFDGCVQFLMLTEVSYDEDCYTILQWTNSCDIGNIYYSGGFTNRLILPRDTDLSQPFQQLQEEGKENGDKRFIATLQRLSIKQRLDTELLPTYVWESLFLLRLHDDITLQLSDGRGTITLLDAEVDTSYEFDQCYATGSLTFTVQDIVKSGCCDELTECDNPELVQNGAFDLQGQFWNFTGNASLDDFEYNSGKASTTAAVSGTGFNQLLPSTIVTNEWYVIRLDLVKDAGDVFVTFTAEDDRTGGYTSDDLGANGSKEILLPAFNTGGDMYLHVWGDNGFEGNVDNISIKKRCNQPPAFGGEGFCLYRGELCDIFEIPAGTSWTGMKVNDGDTETYADVDFLDTAGLQAALGTFFPDNVLIEWDGNCIVIWVMAATGTFNGTTDGITYTLSQPTPTDVTVVMEEYFCA